MTIKEKIKAELMNRFASGSDIIEIKMKKTGDVVIITPDSDPLSDPDTVFDLRGYMLQTIEVSGLDKLADTIMDYYNIVSRQQYLIARLDEFRRTRIDTGMATESEKKEYVRQFKGLFGYDPIEDFIAFCYA